MGDTVPQRLSQHTPLPEKVAPVSDPTSRARKNHSDRFEMKLLAGAWRKIKLLQVAIRRAVRGE